MTGLILVVDDVPANVKLLEAKLTNEYYDVITAKDGYEAIEQTKAKKPDLILLDVMMPGIDGFETCRQIKQDPEVSHIPIVMVTALSEPSDRVAGLEAGADDFITKPIVDTALFARVRSLVRIKVLIDELRLRDKSGAQLGMSASDFSLNLDVSGSRLLLIDDDVVQSRRINEKLVAGGYQLSHYSDHKQALDEMRNVTDLDLIMISTQLADIDGLRLATQFKAVEQLRHVPIIMLVDEDDQNVMLKALELGVNDYLITPVDFNEMLARVKTQIRRKKYQEALKSNYQESVSMAVTDGLTRLYNRHYLDTHLKNLVRQAAEQNRPLSVVLMDMDHFKSVNDTYGHNVGDEVLKALADVIINSIRSADLAARYGGEEFVVLMPETDAARAYEAAERLRKGVENRPFVVSHPESPLRKTVSIGYATLEPNDTPESLLKRADVALYEVKNSGRNNVLPLAPTSYELPPSRQAAREELGYTQIMSGGASLKLAIPGASATGTPAAQGTPYAPIPPDTATSGAPTLAPAAPATPVAPPPAAPAAPTSFGYGAPTPPAAPTPTAPVTPPAAPVAPAAPTSFGYGAPTPPANTPAPAAQPAPTGFGHAAPASVQGSATTPVAPPPAAPAGFGQAAPTAPAVPPASFGQAAPPPTTTPSFGQAPPAAPASFGQASQSVPAAPSFGAAPPAAPSQPVPPAPATPATFGQTLQAPTEKKEFVVKFKDSQ